MAGLFFSSQGYLDLHQFLTFYQYKPSTYLLDNTLYKLDNDFEHLKHGPKEIH